MVVQQERPIAVQSPQAASNVTTRMRVRKRNGNLEPVDVNKIVNAVARATEGLHGVDPLMVSTRTIAALADGSTTRELDELSIRTAAGLIVEEPNYSKLAARLLSTYIDKEVRNQNAPWFSESVALGYSLGLISEEVADFVNTYAPELNAAIDSQRDRKFEFFGIRTVYDRYLLRHPDTRQVIETPQYFFLRVACGLAQNSTEAIYFYDLMSSLAYLPSSPTLFNSGTKHPQMSSCYLLDSPEDSLEGIYKRYTDIAKLSKFAGGIGVAWHRIRSKNSLIVGTNGLSNGIVPWLKTLDSSVAAVNQGGRRKGAACVYLESWHADIEQFLELRDNTGDHTRRTHNINLANWIPDLFMERVKNGSKWSLFDPKKVPQLTDTYGDEFRVAYEQAEADQLQEKQVEARELYQRMMRTLAETGNGWMTFKDAANRKCNQTGLGADSQSNDPDRVVHLSNLCTEIIEVTNQSETAVCNLGSINLGEFVTSPVAHSYEPFNGVALHNSAHSANFAPSTNFAPSANFAPSENATNSANGTISANGSMPPNGLVQANGSVAHNGVVPNGSAPAVVDLLDALDYKRLGQVVRQVVPLLDRVIDINFYPTDEASYSNTRWRPIGLGLMGLQDVFFKLGLAFDSPAAREISRRISEEIYFNALWASTELAEKHGPHPTFADTRAAQGDLQFDLWGIEPTDTQRWAALRERITEHGLRNSLMVAIAPTATIAAISGCFECIEPQVSNLFKRETLSGEFMQVNRYLVADLQRRGLWDAEMIADVKKAEGSVQAIERVPDDLKNIYRTAWEIPMRSLIEMAADRGAFVDQSQSLNLFMESPTINKLSSMYMYAWEQGLKTTYYLRSRPATRINKTTTNSNTCSLENPETCEACD